MRARSGAVAVALSGLRRSYGGVAAVDGIDVEIADGEFFSLLGPSGCGKTTTLRMIAGFVEPSAGPHRRARPRRDRDAPASPSRQHGLPALRPVSPPRRVRERRLRAARERRERRDVVRERVQEILELVDLRGRERAKPAQLSGGQQQRVALARALVLRPEVLLLDEPLGALDLKLRKQLQLQLKRIQHEVGITFVYVTHDQEEAFFMSDRVAIMREGRIEQLGRPQEVYERPQTEFVADFVGAANRIAALVVAVHADGTYDAELDGVGAVRAPGVGGLRAGQRVCAVVRPEVITPTDEPPPGCAHVACRVSDLAYLGDHVSAVVDLAGGSQLTLSRASSAAR